MKNTLDPCDYYWKKFQITENLAFGWLLKYDGPRAVEVDLKFKENKFEEMSYIKNGMSLSYYSNGTVEEYSAVLLDNGKILFCVVRGAAFMGTNHSHERISMEYYELTKI